MELDSIEVNPLELSLDELIALNKKQHSGKEQEDNHTVDEIAEVYHVGNQSSDVCNIARTIPSFGSRRIHYRLGYNNNMQRGGYQFKQSRVQKCLKNARKQYWNKTIKVYQATRNTDMNSSFSDQPLFVSPLTRSSVYTFNGLNPGLKRNVPGSSQSVISAQTMPRHSARDCLNFALQEQIRRLHRTPMRMDGVENFFPTPKSTNENLNVRFLSYI